MAFKAKLRKIGNSLGVLIPKDVITGQGVGDEIELNVITEGKVITDNVITNDSSTGDVITERGSVADGYCEGKDSIWRKDNEGTAYADCKYCGIPLNQPSPQCSRHGK